MPRSYGPEITVVARWDRGWNQPREEAFIFRQVCDAYAVSRLIFIGPHQDGIPKVEQFPELDDALATCASPHAFLEPDAEQTLADLPEGDITYIFGSTQRNNRKESRPEQRYRFLQPHPDNRGIFAITAVGIVLATRYGQ